MKVLKVLIIFVLVCIVAFSCLLAGTASYAASNISKKKAFRQANKQKIAKKVDKQKVAKVHKQKIEKAHKHTPGNIIVISKRGDVDIYVDEDIAGKSPVIMSSVKPGRHLVEAYRGADLVYRKYIIVRDAETVEIEINGTKEIAAEDPNFVI